jgi:hypothetical protein
MMERTGPGSDAEARPIEERIASLEVLLAALTERLEADRERLEALEAASAGGRANSSSSEPIVDRRRPTRDRDLVDLGPGLGVAAAPQPFVPPSLVRTPDF